MLFSKRLNSIVAAVFGLALCAHGAQAPQHVKINQLSTTVEDVVVPLPNEIFGALNKLGAVNWKQHVRSDKGPNFTERPRIALLLGTVIADGFIAVQAEDAPTVKDIGQRVLALAKGIGECQDTLSNVFYGRRVFRLHCDKAIRDHRPK